MAVCLLMRRGEGQADGGRERERGQFPGRVPTGVQLQESRAAMPWGPE